MPNNRQRSEELREKQKSTVERLRERSDLNKKDLDQISKYQKVLDKEVVESKYVLMRELEEEAHKKRMEDAEKEGNKVKLWWESNFGSTGALIKTLGSVTKSLTSEIDASLDKYIGAQQSMSAHLQGSNTSLQNVLNSLQSSLSASGLVRQEKVFDNLSNLIKSGITYNVEQRAFLQTIAEDISSVFDATNGSLTRLIRVQQQDSSANRLAIEYNLQTFLNQNYNTSEYIKQAFNDVSGALLSAQIALQDSAEAMRLESAVQTQLGSMYSGGISQGTINSLASAINALGTGDISNLGSGGISNLLIMAAARAGMDYGQLLNQGVTGQQATTLLNSVIDYMNEMNASGSNVVKSQLGKLFGVDISDIVASRNVSQVSGSVGDDIGLLFDSYSGFTSFGTKFKNTIENMKWSFGTNIASSESTLKAYEITKIISQSGIGNILQGIGETISSTTSGLGIIGGAIGGLAGGAMQLLGIAANNAPLVPIITSLFGEGGTIDDIRDSWNLRSNGLGGIFESLGGSASSMATSVDAASRSLSLLSSFDFSNADIRTSSAGVSGSMYISSTGVSDLLSGTLNSLSSVGDMVSSVISVEGEEISLEDNVATMTSDLASILEILNTYMQSMDDRLQTISINTAGSMSGIAYNYATAGTHLI